MGQSKKKRMCPAVGREITSAECGAGRNTRLACPPSCPHNPFSPENYAQALAIEDGLTPKVLRRMAAEPGSAYPVPSGRMAEDLDFFVRSVRARFFDRDVTGKTFAERWQAVGYAGLTNDERVLFAGQAQLRLVLLELHRVEAEQCVGPDLLEPESAPLVVRDRSLAGMAVRFLSLLTWAYPLPQYGRLHGMATVIPECPGLAPLEVVRAVVRHLGGPAEMPALREWLQPNFALMHRALGALEEGLRQRTFAQMAVSYHTAVYRLRTPAAELARRFAALPALVPEPLPDNERKEGYTQSWVWLDEKAATQAECQPGTPTLGNVALGPEHLCLKGGMGQRFAQLRAEFERAFGQDVELVGERTDDVARQLAQKHPPQFDAALVPPELLALAPKYEMRVSLVRANDQRVTDTNEMQRQVLRGNVSTFADAALPAMDGRTPREAARDPLLRPKLVALMKRHVRLHDTACRRLGEHVDINGLLRDLGLTELDFPPPPITPLPDEAMAAALDEAEEDFAHAPFDDDRPPAPPLPAAPLTGEEVSDRFERVVQEFGDPNDMVDACDDDSDGLIDLVESMTEDCHERDRFSLVLAVATAWYLFFPPEFYAEPLDFALLEANLQTAFQQLQKLLEQQREQPLDEFVKLATQPAVFACAAMVLGEEVAHKKKVSRDRQEAQIKAIVVLRAVVDTLDTMAH